VNYQVFYRITGWTYNSADLPITMKYPDNEIVTYTYDSRMLLDTVIGNSTYVSDTQYDSAGRLLTRTLGNGLTQTYNYYPWSQQGGRLQTLTTGTLQSLAYTYDSVGNVQTIADAKNSGQKQCFRYDALNRLTQATTYADSSLGCTTQLGAGNYNEMYGYDSAGNLQTKGDLALQYLNSSHVHAVTDASGNSYQYDANGNMTRRVIVSGTDQGTFDLYYNAENRLVEVKKNNSTMALFTYDGDGRRVKSVVNGETTLFAGGHYEVQNPGQQGQVITKSYFAGAQRVAIRKYTAPLRMNVEYMIGDHLGSTSVTTDSAGAKVSEIRYKPWGEIRSWWTDTALASLPSYSLTKQTFTGQRSYMDDPSTIATEGFGLMDYNARMYDPYLNRFTQPDSIVPLASQGTQAWDRYAYANNNPVRNVDPSGHRACDDYDEQGNCITDPLGRLLDYVYGTIVNDNGVVKKKYSSALGVMNMIVKEAAYIYGNDWEGFLSATSYVFLGVYDSSPYTMLLAHNAGSSDGFRGITFNSGAGDDGFNFDFQDDDNQVRHFWAAFATAASGGDGIIEAYKGNFYHDVVEDWMGHADTTVKDYTLSLVAIEIAADVSSGAIASPSDLPSVFNALIGTYSPGYPGSDLQWLFTTPYQ
jgi:RHS repeat-associated protein